MRVSCLQENLAKGLSIVGRAVSTRSTLPVLGNILLEAKDNQLRLAATNLEIGINCWIGAMVEDEGAITVPARLLADFINNLPPERIDMELSVRTQTLSLRCARYTATIKGIDASQFPFVARAQADEDEGGSMADVIDGVTIPLEAANLRKMIDQVVYAASTDESRPTLTGVEVRFRSNELRMAATDGYRLSVRSVIFDEAIGPNEEIMVVVPAKSLGELARIAADADDEEPVKVIVAQSRNQILFQIPGNKDEARGSFQWVELSSQLIDGRFPDYNGIIPKSRDTRTVVDTAELLKAVRVAFLFARENNNIIRLTVMPDGKNGADDNKGQLRLTATSMEMGDSVNDIDAQIDGGEIEISFNAKYLIDVLSQVDQPQVVLDTTQSTRPGALRPVGVGEDEYLHVIMPMHPNR
ncbi:MAG: DNA polymerase III subunit beta [Caldilineaceae bacterium]|nr:DNA polymerase III subunit beta [Caldilineaceae bacterium]